MARIHIGPGIDHRNLGLVQILAAISYGMHEAAIVGLGHIFGPAAMVFHTAPPFLPSSAVTIYLEKSWSCEDWVDVLDSL